jgi:tetratricopeptide (TPR) repeat protein
MNPKEIYKEDLKEIFFYLKKNKYLKAKKKIDSLSKKFTNDAFLENLYGNILLSLEDLDSAINKFGITANLEPDNAIVYYNLAICFLKKNNPEEAFKHLFSAIDKDSNYYDAYFELARLYRNKKDFNKSLEHYYVAIKLLPTEPKTYIGLGILYLEINNLIKAEENLTKAIALDNKNDFAFYNLADIYKKNKDYKKAINLLEAKQSFFKDKSFLYGALGENFCLSLDFKKGEEYLNKSTSLKYTDKYYPVYLFNSQYIRGFDRKKYFHLAEQLQKNFLSKKLKAYNIVEKNKIKKKSIKVGFLNKFFHHHAVSYQILGVLNELSKINELEIIAYSDNFYEDDITKKLKEIFHSWKNICFLNDQDAYNEICADELDVLIDLQGHSGNSRYNLLISRCAPIQINWCGFLDTLGLREVDYIIADQHTIPKEFYYNYKEKIIYMPDIWSTIDTSLLEERPKALPVLTNHFITFGSVANPLKINEDVVKVWSSILKNVNNSKILLKYNIYKNDEIVSKIKKLFTDQGITEDRIIIESSVGRKDFMTAFNRMDIMLDTFPYSGGTTNLEASFMAVPILTMTGINFFSRCGVSVNENLNMQEWIANSSEDYISKGISFASDINKLEDFKNKLLKERINNKIFNNELFAKNFFILIKDLLKNKE